jgi:hypothetical protein
MPRHPWIPNTIIGLEASGLPSSTPHIPGPRLEELNGSPQAPNGALTKRMANRTTSRSGNEGCSVGTLQLNQTSLRTM